MKLETLSLARKDPGSTPLLQTTSVLGTTHRPESRLPARAASSERVRTQLACWGKEKDLIRRILMLLYYIKMKEQG